MESDFELPLFPLDMVLLPHRRVPLHIFEDRYKLMINECQENNTEFGMVWGSDTEFCDMGCAARVVHVINRFPDGRMNIVVEGTRRIRVLNHQEIHPYISGTVQDVEDDDESYDLDLGNRVKTLYEEALKLSLGWPASKPSVMELGHLSYAVAANLSLPLSDQQALLENTSVNARLKTVAQILDTALENLREIKRRTGGNGHLA